MISKPHKPNYAGNFKITFEYFVIDEFYKIEKINFNFDDQKFVFWQYK